ncbi:MAG: Ribosome-recycling factor [Parcubacteria group bacterium GW2011_GWA2_40_8]|nr:MAG: Ribosome-recycling factor [Parcubacteria group bacterium GW2011_GWB1_40_14]KKR79130.1 MAG: Ribosome-recycling factor [Parcubacteria group bacterium GW2011_GWA2_40_8]
MSAQDIIKKLNNSLVTIEQVTSTNLQSLRTDRANPAMVEEIIVDAYQSRMRVKELASVTIPEPRVLVIQPWDKSIMAALNKALESSDLGTSPVVQGEIIRIVLPPMSQERRTELTKVVGKKIEEAKISIRQVREDALREIDQLEKQKAISEDEKFKVKDEAQKKVDEFQQKVIALGKAKEEEIMTV